MANWHVFESRDDMVIALKVAIESQLQAAIEARGQASWAVSGGSTPKPLFQAMQNAPLDWRHVDVALVDERWVDYDHPRSNEAFVAENLMQGRAASGCLVGMKSDHATPARGVMEVNKRFDALSLPFDSLLLGLGPDGHTASLFPGAEGIEVAFAESATTCVALTAIQSAVTGEEVERMSLSAKAIQEAAQVVLMITGDEKKQTLEAALSGDGSLPIARVYAMKPFEIYWAP
ncbi:MAG: 6-phosphogluconolactonase [Kordiimonadaceae bacterium]|nr:6-phosphogluconolactonase [Kordiimonadaceae bacterium]MBO6567788.1 6-phosphogluconolactonase [Kordiimonadaceae bacterium]MBO6962997.1 6-phosphogluconolactonase [Kordiimonadaceae bacterium]